MPEETTQTRRGLLRTGAALGVAGLGLSAAGTAAANPGKGSEKGQGKDFGRVYANGALWRTHAVKSLDERPSPEDRLYFLNDGSRPIVANPNASDAQVAPAVSESAPGDRDWTGGKWTTFSAEVTDVEAFNEDAPITSEVEILEADYIHVTLGRPGFGPPNYFICPLNGRA